MRTRAPSRGAQSEAPQIPVTALRHFSEANATVFHLATVTFQTDGASCGYFHGGLQHFAIAQTVCLTSPDTHLDLVPVTLPIILELVVRACQQVITALELFTSNENPTVRVGRSTKLQP